MTRGTNPPEPGPSGSQDQRGPAAAPLTLSADHVQDVAALLGKGARPQAQALLRTFVELPGADIAVLEALAFQAFGLGVHEVAREFYARTTVAQPGDATTWYNLASAERTLGRLEAAERACDRALRCDPGMTAAALLRSDLRKQTPEANHVDQLRGWVARAGNSPAAIALHYALGKELDDLADYEAAFAHFAQGAAIRRAGLNYDVAQDLWKLQRIRETFDKARLGTAPRLEAPAFGFIVGMPRSGTTLIERVLTGNPAVTSNGETDNLLRALMEGSPATEPDIFKRIAAADPARVQAHYRTLSGAGADGGLVLDKLPLNTLYAGAIRLTLPSARLVLLQRTPADNCLAMFTTLFGAGYPFSYDLADLARYFIGYQALVRHWLEAMPDQFHAVSYDAFVADPEPAGAALAAHLAVPWELGMLRVEANRATTATASAAQVRQPIHTGSSGRWRNYARQLSPLTDALERAGIAPFA